MLGATDAELADWLGISPKSVQRLKQRDPAFKAAVLAGGREANANVVYAGYRRAVGMRVVEQKAVVCNGEITIVDLEREIPPDTGAVFKWLHNRERDAWGDGGDGGRLDSLLDLMTMLREYARRHGQAAAAEIAKHHGYSGVLVDGEAEDVSAD